MQNALHETMAISIVNQPEPTQPTFFSNAYFPQKKERGKVVCFLLYFFCLSSTRASTMMFRMNSPAIAGMKYWSVIDAVCVDTGVAVGAASITLNVVSDTDGQ